jgi:hypothetical protein
MIGLADLIADIKKSNQWFSEHKRNQQVHMSGVAICGFKYRFEQENKIIADYSTKYIFGSAVEKYLYEQIKRRDNSYIAHFGVSLLTRYGFTIAGSTDVCSLKENHIIEIKTSGSDKYIDIYIRQLKAYMIAYLKTYDRLPVGSLWLYNSITGAISESQITISDKDIAEFDKNIVSYADGVYIEGIENSLCTFCKNIECPANKMPVNLRKKYLDTCNESSGNNEVQEAI